MRHAPGLVYAYLREIARGVARYRLCARDVLLSLPAWWRSTTPPLSDPVADRRPWMTFGALRYLHERVKPGSRVFEYGVGGSTVFFLDRDARLVSVDHDPAWTERVSAEFPDRDGWELHTITPRDHADGQYASHVVEGSFRDYVTVIEKHPARSFDVVVVDGRARSACLRHAVSRVAPGGLLVLDNSERAIYREAAGDVDKLGWRRHDFFGPGPYNRFFWQTTIWEAQQSR